MKQAVNTGAVRKLERVCVFCGSSAGNDPGYLAAARSVGQLLARRGITLVFGGGRVGMMGAVAEAALSAGGKVIGVIPEGLVRKEQPRDELTELHVVRRPCTSASRSWPTRPMASSPCPAASARSRSSARSSPGRSSDMHAKPCGLLNVKGYYAGLLALFDHAAGRTAFCGLHSRHGHHRGRARGLLDAMAQYHAPAIEKWLTSEATLKRTSRCRSSSPSSTRAARNSRPTPPPWPQHGRRPAREGAS